MKQAGRNGGGGGGWQDREKVTDKDEYLTKFKFPTKMPVSGERIKSFKAKQHGNDPEKQRSVSRYSVMCLEESTPMARTQHPQQ